MTIATTPQEGSPQCCPVCEKIALFDVAPTDGNSCCGDCQRLFTWFRERFSRAMRIRAAQVTLATEFRELGISSVAFVEAVLDVEEELDVDFPGEVTDEMKTIADIVRHIEQHRQRGLLQRKSDRTVAPARHLAFVDDGETRLFTTDAVQLRLRELRHTIHKRHSAAWAAAGPLRRLILRWRIETEFRRERRNILPAPESLYSTKRSSASD